MICKHLQECIQGQLSATPLEKCDNKDMDCCIASSDKRSQVKCEENKRKYILENTKKNHVISYRMDGGVVKEDATVSTNVNKCDYLFVVNSDESTAILTELKGVRVLQSFVQLKGTIDLYRDVFKTFNHVYARSVVTSSVPNIKATPEYRNLEILLRTTYNGNLKIKERQFVEKDTELHNRQ